MTTDHADHTERTSGTGSAGAAACPACGAPGRLLRHIVQERYRLLRCTGCRTEFLRDPVPGGSTAGEYWEDYKVDVYAGEAVRVGYEQRYAAELEEQTPVAHNMYVEVAAELGMLGLAGFVGMIAVALWSAERAVRAAGPGPGRLLPLAVQTALIAVCVASTFLSEQYYMPLWALTAAACAVGLRSDGAIR